MKRSLSFGAILSVSAFVASFSMNSASAQDVPWDAQYQGYVGLSTDYAHRGISRADESFALQAGVELEHNSGLYGGVDASSVDFNDSDEAKIELDIGAGYRGVYENVRYEGDLSYYMYPGANDSLDYDYAELSAKVGYDFDVVDTEASISYSPDYLKGSGSAQYYKLGAEVPIDAWPNLKATGHVGYQVIDDERKFGVPDYTEWSLGAEYSYYGLDFTGEYSDTDLDEPSECVDGCDARLVLGVSKSF